MTTGSATTSACPTRWHDLIPGPDFGLGMVAALLGSTKAARSALESSLASGVLVSFDGDSLDGLRRYRVHVPHGNLVLPADDERPAVLRMLEALLRQLVAVDDRLDPGGYRSADLDDLGYVPAFPDDAAALRWFTAEFATILAAQHLAAAIGEDVLVRWFGEVSWAAARVTGRVREMLAVQTLAADAAQRADHPAAAIPRARCCWVLLKLGHLDQALDVAEHAWELAERHGLDWARAVALHALGDVYHALGRYDDALESYQCAQDIDAERVQLTVDGTTTALPLAWVGMRRAASAATHLAAGFPAHAVREATIAVSYLAEDDRHPRPRDLAWARIVLAKAMIANGQARIAGTVLALAAAALDPTIDQCALDEIRALRGETAPEQAVRSDRAPALSHRNDADAAVAGPLATHDSEVRT